MYHMSIVFEYHHSYYIRLNATIKILLIIILFIATLYNAFLPKWNFIKKIGEKASY